MLWLQLATWAAASAYTIKGSVNSFEIQDVQTTTVQLTDGGTTTSELLSSSGTFTLRDVADGEYKLSLLSTTLEDNSHYILNLEEGVLAVTRVQNSDKLPVSYPIEIGATRRNNVRKRRMPRLRDIITDKTVILAVIGLVAVTAAPKLIMNMEEEDLKMLQIPEGESALDIAQKFAKANTS